MATLTDSLLDLVKLAWVFWLNLDCLIQSRLDFLITHELLNLRVRSNAFVLLPSAVNQTAQDHVGEVSLKRLWEVLDTAFKSGWKVLPLNIIVVNMNETHNCVFCLIGPVLKHELSLTELPHMLEVVRLDSNVVLGVD